MSPNAQTNHPSWPQGIAEPLPPMDVRENPDWYDGGNLPPRPLKEPAMD